MTEPSIQAERQNVRSLQDAIRKMRIVATERADVLTDLAAAEKARLQLLSEELTDVFKSVPIDTDFFAFTVSGGETPRLWIDMTSHVAMARDRRTYRFLKDTRLGRAVILESAVLDDMADCITNYVAERIIERERALEADWMTNRARTVSTPIGAEPPKDAAKAKPRKSDAPKLGAGRILLTFLLGAAVGVATLVAWAWFRT